MRVPGGAPKGRRRWRIAVLLGASVVVNYFDRLAVVGPQLKSDLHFDTFKLGVLFSVLSLSYAICQIPSGILLDRLGVTRVGRFGILLWAIASGLTALVGGFGGILVAPLLLSVAEAPSFPLNSEAVGYWFPRSERSTATSLFDGVGKPADAHHTLQPLPRDRVMVVQNGNPAKPAHLDDMKVVEYDMTGKGIWSYPATRPWGLQPLKNGNTLISNATTTTDVIEVDRAGKVVWRFSQADVEDFRCFEFQGVARLANGNTIICNWCVKDLQDVMQWPSSAQVFEVTRDKKIALALSQWDGPGLGPGSMIQSLDLPGGLGIGA